MKKIGLIIAAIMLTVFTQANNEETKKPGSEKYYLSKVIAGDLETVTQKVKEVLKSNGFGVVSEIDMHKTLNEKAGADMKGYRLLGVCNPKLAYQAVQAEENIGLFLPCKMILKETEDGTIEVVSVIPTHVMKMIGNKKLDTVAEEVTKKLEQVMEGL